jgi:hypothetical protein
MIISKPYFIVLTFMLNMSLFPQSVQHDVRWENINRISFDSATSVVPQVVISGDTVHVVWFGEFSNTEPDSGWGIIYARSVNNGISFTNQKRLVHFDSASVFKSLSQSSKYLYLIYFARVDSPIYWSTAIIRSTDRGNTWEERRIIKDYTPYAVAVKDSHIFIYSGLVENNKYYNAMLVSNDYGLHWDTLRIQLSGGPNVAKLTTTNNSLHLVRTIGFNQYEEVIYNKSTDFGYTWSLNDTLTTNDGQNSQLPKMVSSDSSLYLIWNDQKYGGDFSGTILLKRSFDEGITWGEEQIISQLNTAVFCDIGMDKNMVSIVWNNQYDSIGQLRIRTSDDFGNTFNEYEKISPAEYRAGDPSVFISNANIYTSWWNHSNGEIYFRKGVFQTLSVNKNDQIVKMLTLSQNYPNPFNPQTTIRYELPNDGNVSITVYDLLGREVSTVIDTHQHVGEHSVTFDGTHLSAGMYLYRLVSGAFTETRKMILLK